MLTPYLNIDRAQDSQWVHLRLTGELDLCSAPLVKQHLAQLRAEKRNVRLDLTGLQFMDSSGIHLLISAFNDARDEGCHLAIDPDLPPQIARLFRLVSLDRILGDLTVQ